MRNFLYFTLLLCLFSCNENAIYNKSYSFKNEVWSQEVKPSFVFEVKDTSIAYNFIISIRTTTAYRYNNMWLFLNSQPPKGKGNREPFQMAISNPDGSWVGLKTGSVVENRLNFSRKKLPYKGKYIFTLEQGVTEKVLDEILDVTFIVEEAK